MAAKLCEFDYGECRTDFLPLLQEMSRIATESGELADLLDILFDVMERHLKIVRATVSLYDPRAERIFIHRSRGLSGEEAARGIYAPGEGILGKVVESGRARIVPRIGDEPGFLHRAVRREGESDRDLSFLCVPIQHNGRVLGAIAAERLYDNRRLLRLDADILTILATAAAQAVELYLMEKVWRVELEDENHRLRSALRESAQPGDIVGESAPMRAVYSLIERVARTRTTVLILGESGVGKELVASAIHYGSARAKGPFVRFNCAALAESVIESELFGHEKGAFTGAATLRRGRFEEADAGTIFLDEVGELSLATQAKLLRVLQEKRFERVGGNLTIESDVRILAATNRDLRKMVDEGRFRADLFYRINVFPIVIPPLRERGNDVALLARHYAARVAAGMGLPTPAISAAALAMLTCYHWPGNVRELENVIERAVILSEGGDIEARHLPPSLQTPAVSEIDAAGTLDARLAAAEYELIVDALKAQRGNTTKAAEHLGLTRRMLGLRMERYGLNYKLYR
jgi:Nif-specific regulatory protein